MRVPRLITFFIPPKPDAPYNASGLDVTHPADTAVDIEEGTESKSVAREMEMVLAPQNEDQEHERTEA